MAQVVEQALEIHPKSRCGPKLLQSICCGLVVWVGGLEFWKIIIFYNSKNTFFNIPIKQKDTLLYFHHLSLVSQWGENILGFF